MSKLSGPWKCLLLGFSVLSVWQGKETEPGIQCRILCLGPLVPEGHGSGLVIAVPTASESLGLLFQNCIWEALSDHDL